ncbi:hypothetical protein K6973_01365 [Streptococcus dysgalactiae]|uniref:maltose acetyltransferase domain-containing protein n=1 Tax=Streptococcus dysgalactiae TaxID=1334 RepID=UPI001C9DDAB9|nr:maltose acetyltransferase domain-containing protein [Streptococcus dysgalactiae]QZT27441.1 hypothetical protein K6973_01365 [Streptococcus dysgalactiae]
MNDRQRQANGELYDPFQTGGDDWLKARQLCHAFNLSAFWEDSAPLTTLRGLFAASYDDLILTPPFYCNHVPFTVIMAQKFPLANTVTLTQGLPFLMKLA